MGSSTFEDQTRSFLDWFKAQPGATFHPDINIADLRDRTAGRGIVAAADIPEDTVLFTIPRSAIINVLTSDLPKKIPAVFEESTTALEDADNEADEEGSANNAASDSWVSLILVMIYEHLQGPNSKWRPYLDILPDTFDTPMFWSSDELDELQASAIASKVGRDEADNMFRAKVLPVIEANGHVFYPEGSSKMAEDELLNLAHRMGSTIMAYAFDLDSDDDQADQDDEDNDGWVVDKDGQVMMGMVPMADILNADAEPNAHVNHGDDSLTVTSLRPISAGQEILNYYGPLGNGELLRRYGYVTEAHARHDVTEISWSMVLSILKDILKLDDSTWYKAINELELEEIDDTFVLDRDLDEPDSQGKANGESQLKHLPADLQEQIATLLKAVRKYQPDAVPDKQRRDEILYVTMLRVFEMRLAEYPTEPSQDEQLLRQGAGRKQMAIAVRLGEKVLLREAIELTKKRMADLSTGGANGNDEPSSKRQRMA